jgi:anti-anti-sigma regulatory factor
MPAESPKTIAVAAHDDALVIDPGTTCSVTVCPAVHAAICRRRTPVISRIIFDLSEAIRMDSSFVGLMVGMMGRKADRPPAVVQLFRPGREILRTLETMGVLHSFEAIDHLPPVDAGWEEIPVCVDNTDDLCDLIIDAHENLMEADPRNVDKFEPVVRGLRERRGR